MKKKVNFYSIDKKGYHLYEFSSYTDIPKAKPLTNIVIRTALSSFVKRHNITDTGNINHKRNRVYFRDAINHYSLKGKDITCFYCSFN